MEELLQIILNGPLTIVVPFIITSGLVWVIYYFVFPILEKNDKLIEETKKLNVIIDTDIKYIKSELDNINRSIMSIDNKKLLEELESDISELIDDYPKIEVELNKVISKIMELKDYMSSSKRTIDNTAQIIGILKSLESLERSIETIKERQTTQAAILSVISNNIQINQNNISNINGLYRKGGDNQI